MNAAETIAKAIEKLEGLKESCTVVWTTARFYWKNIGPLEGWWREVQDELGSVAILHERDDDTEVVGGSSEANAELIVTLHRTIDAQLAILRGGGGLTFAGHWSYDSVLPLAEAILGDAA